MSSMCQTDALLDWGNSIQRELDATKRKLSASKGTITKLKKELISHELKEATSNDAIN